MDVLLSRALVHFVAAYDAGNLREAALDVGVTQPAVSKSIQKIEERIGVKLFNRTSAGLKPTVTGQVLRRHTRGILNEARSFEAEIATLVEGSRGEVRFGVGPAWSLTVFPSLLEQFCTRFPGLDVVVETGVTDQMWLRLVKGDIDYWLGSLHGLEDTEDISICSSGSSELRVFVREDHPLKRKKNVLREDLLAFNWATFSGDKIGLEKLRVYFESNGLEPPRVSHKLGSMISMFRLAAQSDLLVLVARSVQAEAMARGLSELSSPGEIWTFPTGMAFRRTAGDLNATTYLAELVSEIAS